MDNILAAAQTIATARRNRTPLAALPPGLVPADEAEGYRIQRAVHDLLLPQVGSLVGYKIGCTSAVMQQYLDIPHPCAGGVFAKGVHDSGARLRSGDYVRVGVECEIAVRLARDLQAAEQPFTAGERTGKFRLGTDQLLTASDGKSWISFEDFAVALADEIERPAHIRRRFTVGY
jgi:2-keto-4-pentenoate hydratase